MRHISPGLRCPRASLIVVRCGPRLAGQREIGGEERAQRGLKSEWEGIWKRRKCQIEIIFPGESGGESQRRKRLFRHRDHHHYSILLIKDPPWARHCANYLYRHNLIQ